LVLAVVSDALAVDARRDRAYPHFNRGYGHRRDVRFGPALFHGVEMRRVVNVECLHDFFPLLNMQPCPPMSEVIPIKTLSRYTFGL